MKENFTDIAKQLDPFIYQRFKQALETGRWPDGRTVSSEQRELCMQAVISYEAANLSEENRTGYIEQSCKNKDDSKSKENVVTEEKLTISQPNNR